MLFFIAPFLDLRTNVIFQSTIGQYRASAEIVNFSIFLSRARKRHIQTARSFFRVKIDQFFGSCFLFGLLAPASKNSKVAAHFINADAFIMHKFSFFIFYCIIFSLTLQASLPSPRRFEPSRQLPSFLSGRHEGDRQRGVPQDRSLAQQSGGERPPAGTAARTKTKTAQFAGLSPTIPAYPCRRYPGVSSRRFGPKPSLSGDKAG